MERAVLIDVTGADRPRMVWCHAASLPAGVRSLQAAAASQMPAVSSRLATDQVRCRSIDHPRLLSAQSPPPHGNPKALMRMRPGHSGWKLLPTVAAAQRGRPELAVPRGHAGIRARQHAIY